MQTRIRRSPAAMPVRIDGRRGPLQGRIDNISRTGARLRHGGEVPKGERLAIRLAGEDVTVTVLWSRGPLAGIRFAGPLAPERLAAIAGGERPELEEGAPQRVPAPGPPSSSCGMCRCSAMI
ncbi:PilZ domain-containing protein [Hasllibacter halocynthiae]|uniref:PilZ domain-containing protein n=1 Tax=Hasllibacter halocynthiae TaxID=595589 RepID=A0A2T0X6A1_9RHOB|nr:PilZ domain-containing protein [Hasllibacter halocynthiae]PRY94482.1 PilZ domain-containing protein [Hasllibacter halocynthiae]